MKYLRYMGEFVSVSGVVWRVEILQEADSAFATVGALEFDIDEPLSIDWEKKSKDTVICGSIATLKVISPGDRTYEDLYSIEVGRIRMDVYRNNSLYWSGCIDTEFYEEPYEQANGYVVSLTFSDFGVLDRLKYSLANMQTLIDIISYCVGRSGINSSGIDDSLISTQLSPTGPALSLSDIKVRSDNFFDEDGDAASLAKVIDGILQPLALRMVQRAGKVYIYDLNGLYAKASVKQITWDGSSQTMGVDEVYNNAKITWSTYAQSGNLSPENCWSESIKTDSSLMALNNLGGGSKDGANYFSYHYSTSLRDWIDATDCGFTIWLAKDGQGVEIVNDKARFFKIVPQYDGTESEGVAILWTAYRGYKVGGSSNWSAELKRMPYGVPTGSLVGDLNNIGAAIFKTSPVWVPPVDNANGLLLRVGIDMLMDTRFNPFESASNLMKGAEQKDWYNQFTSHGNFVYVPVTIKYQPDGSDTVYVWTNQTIVSTNVSSPVTTLAATYGRWVAYTSDSNPNAWGYLAYYDAKDRKNTCGVLGWKKNRPAINPHNKGTISILTNAEAGQYIPYPNFGGGGKLWVEVRSGGWQISDGGKTLQNVNYNNPKELWGKCQWILMKMPQIEIMNNSQFDQGLNTDDVEYSAEINSAAKEEIKIDTICGTSAEGVPTARGAYFDASTGKQITQLTRAGRTTQAEDLLIGTLFSQFAQRHTMLSGEAKLLHDPMAIYEEANQEGKKFILIEDVQDARLNTSDAVFVELSPDEYTHK